MRKYTYNIVFAISALLFLAGCHLKKAKQKLVIYSPHGKEMLGEFEKLFEAAHPDVNVEWLDMGSQEVFDRVSTESQNPQADIWWGAPSTMFIRAEKLGLLQQYKPTWANNVRAYAKSKNNFWYGTFSTPQVIAFNSNKLSADKAPKDWDEIASPAWRGKVVFRNPLASGTLRAIFCAMLARSVAQTGNEEQGWKWLRQLDSNTIVYAADPTQMYNKLGGQNEAVTLWNMPDMILQKDKYNYPFGYNIPQSGTIVLTDGIAIIKGTKNEVMADSFYEFVTTQQSLLIQATKYYRIPSRTDIPRDSFPDWLKNTSYKTLDVDWDEVADKETEWMKKWDAEVKTSK